MNPTVSTWAAAAVVAAVAIVVIFVLTFALAELLTRETAAGEDQDVPRQAGELDASRGRR